MGMVNIYVTTTSGKGKKGVKVSGETSGLLGGFTKSVRTDIDGLALLEWSSSSSLSGIYINGKKHSGTYRSGQKYVFNA